MTSANSCCIVDGELSVRKLFTSACTYVYSAHSAGLHHYNTAGATRLHHVQYNVDVDITSAALLLASPHVTLIPLILTPHYPPLYLWHAAVQLAYVTRYYYVVNLFDV